MKSVALSKISHNKAPVTSGASSLAIYQLASIFAASHELANLPKRHSGLIKTCNEFQVPEASWRLVWVAALVKRTIDTLSASAQWIMDMPVGQLQPDIRIPERSLPLGLREACDRILHANEIGLLQQELQNDSIVLRYDIVLAGWTDQGDWRAILNIPRFLDVASTIS